MIKTDSHHAGGAGHRIHKARFVDACRLLHGTGFNSIVAALLNLRYIAANIESDQIHQEV